jgi:hypothetical protein
MIRRRGAGGLTLLYVIIGAFVAGSHDYFERLSDIEDIASGLLALLLWPLVLLGIDLKL